LNGSLRNRSKRLRREDKSQTSAAALASLRAHRF
jgi:hypothetical protein